MLYAILNFLCIVAVLIGVVAWCVGFAAAARATALRGSQMMSTEVKALQKPDAETATDRAEKLVPSLQRRMLKSMLVFVMAIAVAAGFTFLRNLTANGGG